MNKIYDEITIVTVLYNSAKIDESFFENLKSFKTVVVDNGKNEEILDKIKTVCTYIPRCNYGPSG